ncbi:MAG: PDZ domain-containing protein [Bacteroidota bacterium]|jgi:S1-C subfamily serine protease
MKHFLAALTTALLLINPLHSSQEVKQFTRTISADDAIIIREIGAVVLPKENMLVVNIILGNHEKTSVDIQKDDRILMMNGKKLKGIKDLRELYEKASVGQEIKLGLKRNENLLIATFTKKSNEELNKEGSRGGMVMRMEREEGEILLPALGLALKTKGDKAVVNKTLPTASNNFITFSPIKDDIIVSINGKSVSSAEEFDEAYTELNEGDKVTIVFSRDGKTSKETFNKPKPMGRMIMRK